jgi:hypothetical protein
MYVYAGYIPEKASYMKDVLEFDFDTHEWKIVYKEKTGREEPEGRSNSSMVELDGGLWVFGGTNGTYTLSDMWKFDLVSKEWKAVENKETPEVPIL